jgi:pimeloyl-ACP methyl ester carboxylesterase
MKLYILMSVGGRVRIIFSIIILLFLFAGSKVSAQTILFEDNFDTTPNGTVPEKWTIIGPSGWSVKDGQYGVNASNNTNTIPKDEYWDGSKKNIDYEVDAQWLSGENKNIPFHYIDISNYYEIHYNNDNDGTIHLDRHIASECCGTTITSKKYILTNGVTYHFKIETVEKHIKISIDSQIIFDIDDPSSNPIMGGKIGLRAGGAQVWYDNVKVTEIVPTLPQLKVIEVVNNYNGGNAKTEDFILKVGATTVTSGATNSFDVGTYAVTETGPTGYSGVFSGDCDSNGQITLNTGDALKTCTITNTDVAPTITLTNVINNNGGGAGPNEFGISIGGNVVTSGSATQVRANSPIIINEAGHTDYNFVSITGTNCPTQLGGTVTLSPGQNISCTITNTYVPPPPPPVTKVFFVPGIGASWNADALLNCKPDNYFGGWILAPFAEEIYKPILEVLSSSGWDTRPFYYDWRKDVRDSANILSGYIGANSNPDEKVDLVGHSMGGLVGRAYVQLYQGGQLAKLLMVGSPHQGSSLAYPLWSGGEIWTDNLLEKIAVTLYLNHCGGLFSNNRQVIQDQSPSIQNLLPTNNYLFDMQTQKLKPVSTMSAKNNWLPADFIAPFWSVKVGTLSGTGFPTLNIINVISPSKNDLRQGNWTDGKPIGKQYTNQGDGTVLASSSQLEGAINTTINQTHSGLVASTEGMTEILRFLGSPNSLEDPVYIEPSSALLIIGYPGNFWVTDPNGNVTQDQAGVVSFINPVSGNYDLRVVPTSTDTLFIIAQFLPNGQTFYKEYHIKGIQPISKIVTFDTKHPSGDILKDKVTPKPPSFPKIPKFPNFWSWFWGWWRKK